MSIGVTEERTNRQPNLRAEGWHRFGEEKPMGKTGRKLRWAWLAVACGAVTMLTGQTARAARTLEFSGYTWSVRANSTPGGPGPNVFSDSAENVWLDEQGRLHMRITHRGENWQCAEITCTAPLGYGTFRWV